MHAVIHFVLILLARFPKIGGFLGLIFAVVFSYAGFRSWLSLQKIPQEPLYVSLEEAAVMASAGGDFWVTIKEVSWDCANFIHIDVDNFVQTEAIFTDKTGAIVGVALFGAEPKGLSCKDLGESNITGMLSKMSTESYERLPEKRFDVTNYQNPASRLFLCTFCGRGNSTLGIIVCTLLTLIGLAIYPLSLSLRRQYEKERSL